MSDKTTGTGYNIIITVAEKEALQKRLERLINVARPQATRKLQEARELGDLSENQLYDEALKQISDIDSQIDQIKEKIANAQVVDTSQKLGIVSMGDTILAQFKELNGNPGVEFKFKIVGSIEADPAQNKFSAASPVGKAIVGLKKGDNFSYTVSNKTIEGVIKDIIDEE
jgi:transcription elongation factor GreA